MQFKNILLIVITVSIFSCETKQQKIKNEIDVFKEFSDSLLRVNKHYVEVLYGDTNLFNITDPFNPALSFNDTAIQLHSNIFDTTTEYTQKVMIQTLIRYNNLEQKFDSLKPLMDNNTIQVFETVKNNINTIKQPVK
jgi:hypothetical protein